MSTMPSVSVRGTMATTADNPDLPAWVRIGCLGWALADPTGHARLSHGQLSRTLGLTAPQTSQALEVARSRGWIDQSSTAACIVLPGCCLGSCSAKHR